MASLKELAALIPYNEIPAYNEETAGEALAAAEAHVGRRIMIWWASDAAYYGGIVASYSRTTGMHKGTSRPPLPLTSLPPPWAQQRPRVHAPPTRSNDAGPTRAVEYDDGDKETICLSQDSKQSFYWVEHNTSPSKKGGAHGGGSIKRGGANNGGDADSSSVTSAKSAANGTGKAAKGKAAKGKAINGKAVKGKAAKGKGEVKDKGRGARAEISGVDHELVRTGVIDMDARSRSEKRQIERAMDESNSKRGRTQRSSKQPNPPPTPPRQVKRGSSAPAAPKNRALAQVRVCNRGRVGAVGSILSLRQRAPSFYCHRHFAAVGFASAADGRRAPRRALRDEAASGTGWLHQQQQQQLLLLHLLLFRRLVVAERAGDDLRPAARERGIERAAQSDGGALERGSEEAAVGRAVGMVGSWRRRPGTRDPARGTTCGSCVCVSRVELVSRPVRPCRF